MAIKSVARIWEEQNGSHDASGNRQYTVPYRVITTDQKDGVLTVGQAVDPATGLQIPRLFSSYEDPNGAVDRGSFCSRLEVRVMDPEDPCCWSVICHYGNIATSSGYGLGSGGGGGGGGGGGRPGSSAASNADQGKIEPNPFQRPLEASVDRGSLQETRFKDVTGKLYANSSGQMFRDLPQVNSKNSILRVAKNMQSFPWDLQDQYQDAMNSEEFLGKPAATWRCNSITGRTNYERDDNGIGYYYWVVTFELEYNKATWFWRPVDKGFCEKINGKLVQMTDQTGAMYQEEQLLDGNGRKLTPGAEPKFLSFQPLFAETFADLKISGIK
jgi:hypothetical protein